MLEIFYVILVGAFVITGSTMLIGASVLFIKDAFFTKKQEVK